MFSRVGSEMQALQAAGIPYELVPGVSSALAAPLLAGEVMHLVRLLGAYAEFGAALALSLLADYVTLCCQLPEGS